MRVLIYYNSEIISYEKIRYVFDFIFSLPFISKKIELFYDTSLVEKYQFDIIINYGNDEIKNQINIINHPSFINKDDYSTINNLKSIKYIYENQVLYGVSVHKQKRNENIFYENNIIFLDIPQTFFFHLSRLEESIIPKKYKDYHGRMKTEFYFLIKNELEKIPVLDNIAVAFAKILHIYEEVNITKVLTHDIDVIVKYPNFYRFARGLARIILKNKKNKGSLFKYIFWFFKSKVKQQDPFDVKDWFFEKVGFDKKVVYFMSGGVTEYDNFYDIKSELALKWIDKAKNNNYNIGLHPSYNTFNDYEQFNFEQSTLSEIAGSEIIQSRQHILRFDINTTIDILESNKIINDSTLSYYDRIGFRAGTGYNFKLWNFTKNTCSNIIETPLVIMDGCLLFENNYNVSDAINFHNNFIKDIRSNTQITYNFHNSIFDPVLLDSNKLIEFYLNEI